MPQSDHSESRGRRLALVGHFQFTEEIRRAAQLWVLESIQLPETCLRRMLSNTCRAGCGWPHRYDTAQRHFRRSGRLIPDEPWW